MRFGVVVFPGSNCDRDCFYVIKELLRQPVKYIWHKNTDLNNFGCIILPGGFSYGDYLRTGAVARFSPVMQALTKFARNGGLVVGICNGFQILLEAGLLPGAMLRNENLHFICKQVFVRVENNKTPFTHLYKRNQILKVPIAHNEGNYYIDGEGLKKINENNQIVLRYSSCEGEVKGKFNPNGARDNIAGIINEKGNVLGMMPHPERSAQRLLGSEDGFLIFQSIVEWLKG